MRAHASCYATVSSLQLSTHASCYATVSSLELSTHASCNATVSSLELSTHASCYATVSSFELSSYASRYAIVSSLELSTHASCYATVSSLELSTYASCYATVSSLELSTQASCFATVSSLELFTHASCYATVSFLELSNISGTQTLDRSWKSLKDFLPAHMVLKHKDRRHSKMHPSVTQYMFMWCWRCSLENPDPQRFLEEHEALLWPRRTQNMSGRISFRVGKNHQNASFVYAKCMFLKNCTRIRG